MSHLVSISDETASRIADIQNLDAYRGLGVTENEVVSAAVVALEECIEAVYQSLRYSPKRDEYLVSVLDSRLAPPFELTSERAEPLAKRRRWRRATEIE